MPNQSDQELTPLAKSTLKVIFLTLFLDLVGFSIIFPLFPELLKHYLAVDPENIFLKGILDLSSSIMSISGGDTTQSIVLFGGILGSLYSLLQFVAAPLWGTLSDRIGRKPVLIISISGLFLSYVVWFFSASFTMIVIARIIGGLMAGNISTASAAVADVTSTKNRSKGMAVIGIAFATGFVIGPALGGILSQWDLSSGLLEGVWGVNPFSVPAALAGILCLVNLFMVIKSFKETRNPEKSEVKPKHSRNPFKLLAGTPYKGVNKTNYIYFLFLTAFSGMEFTLTFLASERLGFSSLDNGIMFIFIGFVMAMVQGGFVRRKASKIGEEKLVFIGMILSIPGLLILSQTGSVLGFYAGLFFLSVSSAIIIPCLTALTSIYAPSNDQGRILGIFRSLGSLSRVIGPFAAGVIYWRFGSEYPYLWGSLFIVIPLVLAKTFPARPIESQS